MERFLRSHRLAKQAEYARVFKTGRRRRGALLECCWTDNSLGHPRMGLVVPKFRATGVARNRLRRRLKEIWRREVQPVQPAWDLVIRISKPAYEAPFAALRAELLAWRDAVCPPPALPPLAPDAPLP